MDIKTIVKERGFLMEDVAKEMGISPITLSQTISRNPTVKTLQRIANVIGCQVGDFFQDETESHDYDFICPHCGKPIKVSKPDSNK